MKQIRTEVEIDAPPSVVWDVLTDLTAYADWNPHITAASGDPHKGGTVEIRVQPSGSRSQDATVTVTAAEPERKLEWSGDMVHSRIFHGVHTFELEPLDGGERTRFVNRERLSGLLIPFVINAESRLDYEAMNRALARRAEKRHAEQGESAA